MVSCCHDPHAKICKVRSEWHALCLRSMPKNPKQKLGWIEVCTGLPDIFHRRKKRRELCRTETPQILTQQFHEQFCFNDSHSWFFRPIRVFHNLSISFICLFDRDIQEEILRGLFRFAASVADVPTLVRLQVGSKFEKNPRGLCYATFATFKPPGGWRL